MWNIFIFLFWKNTSMVWIGENFWSKTFLYLEEYLVWMGRICDPNLFRHVKNIRDNLCETFLFSFFAGILGMNWENFVAKNFRHVRNMRDDFKVFSSVFQVLFKKKISGWMRHMQHSQLLLYSANKINKLLNYIKQV